jgi:hypothetical protein
MRPSPHHGGPACPMEHDRPIDKPAMIVRRFRLGTGRFRLTIMNPAGWGR